MWGVIFLLFLFLPVPAYTMHRRDRQRGCTDRVVSWTGRVVGGVMKNAVKEVDIGALLAEDVIRRPLGEFKRQADATMKSATRKALQEFDKQLDTTLKKIDKNFFKEIVIEHFRKIIFYTSIGIACNICIWYVAKGVTSYITDVLKKPQVVTRSSRKNLLQKLKGFVFGVPKKEEVKMIFPSKLSSRLDQLIEETRHINKHIREGKKGVAYPNVVLVGPPGTGKSMFAEKFAEESGLDYDFVSGSKILESGTGTRVLDDIFQRAEKSKNGSLLFMDEGDSFLLDREQMNPDSQNYRTINHFLALTGKSSSKRMIMTATNYYIGDEAMHRRFPVTIVFPQADTAQRFRILQLYRQTILQTSESGEAFAESVKQYLTDEKLKEIAQETEGYSNADMQTIISQLKSRTFTTKDGLLSPTLINDVVTEFKEGREALQQKPSAKKGVEDFADLQKRLGRKRFGGE